MIEHQDARKIAALFSAISEPTRLRILFLLAQKPHNVGQLAKTIGIPMVNMSHHLGVMRQSGLLEDDKQGRRVIYRVSPDLFHIATDGVAAEALGTLTFGNYKVVLLRKGKLKAKNGTLKKPASDDA